MPESVDLKPSRWWDWYDIQFLSNVSVLDPLIPPPVVIEPGNIDVTHTTADSGAGQKVVILFDGRYRNCDWTVEAPPGVATSVSQANNASTLSVAVDVPIEGQPAGTYTLGDLAVSAARTGGNPAHHETLEHLTQENAMRAVFEPYRVSSGQVWVTTPSLGINDFGPPRCAASRPVLTRRSSS